MKFSDPEVTDTLVRMIARIRNTPALVVLHGKLQPSLTKPSAEHLLQGSPELRTANYFIDSSEQFFAGIWSGTPGKWRVRYTENELCVLTGGRIAIAGDDGGRWSFGPGDAFVVPAGFSGIWEVIESCSKIYAVFEARAPKRKKSSATRSPSSEDL